VARVGILVTMDAAHGPLVITEHDAVIVNQRGALHQSRARLADEADPGSPRAEVGPWYLVVVETESVCPRKLRRSAITDNTSCLLA